ncbi:NUC169 domain-containing protein [Melanogaster broomeanus]|nr:NUC169 domain-containing protein [Melanogaster broomeanus]
MTVAERGTARAAQTKRKEREPDEDQKSAFAEAVRLEMMSDEEGHGGDDGDAESDEEVDEFPEIDARSDTESGEESDEDEEGEESGDEDEDEDGLASGSDSDSDIHIFPKPKAIVSEITGHPKRVYPEIEPGYDSDSSTEDDPNRVGNIPMHWYDDLPHVGYDINGKRVLRPAKGDELDKFLKIVEDPTSWTSALDNNTQMDKPLSPEELDIIRRLQAGENPDAGYDPYEPTTEWFTGKGKEEVMPLSGAPEPKRRWLPSKWEKQKIMKIVRAIRQGRIVGSKPKTAGDKSQFYAIWNEPSSKQPPPLPAPKPPLPTHGESYNPPEEYLPTAAERIEWENTDPEYRERDYLPEKYSALRLVPAYDHFIKQRFNRQLDLYLAPRIQRTRLNIDPNSLIPKLPSPGSLRPFPTYSSLKHTHTNARVRCVSISPEGTWVVSGDESGVVSMWEVNVGREVKRWTLKSKVAAVEWCPRTDASYFVVGTEDKLHFIIPPNLPSAILHSTQSTLTPATLPPATQSPVKWSSTPGIEDGVVLTLLLPAASGLSSQVTWHRKGDYLATVSSSESQGGVWIHQVSRRHSQAPFKKIKGSVQLVLFHPIKPHFFVATQRYVRVYNLAEQKLIKTLMPGTKWISSMDIHPSGDHLIVGGYDKKLSWFDLELNDKPYKILRYHTRAIRSLHFHPTYPLFASSSDDGSIQIFHGRVYSDLMTDPLIVPLKILRGHNISEGLGVLQVKWVSKQPWLVSAGADGNATVWCS